MKKFSQINEAKIFTADPSIIKQYAARIIPYYITGELKLADKRLIDEWLEMNKQNQVHKNNNFICELEIIALKNLFDNPMTQQGYDQLKADIDNKCAKLERFLRPLQIVKFQ